MKNGKDDKGTSTAPTTVENDPHFQQTSRRRFGKQALGAAVLLSIANRGAWGSAYGYGRGSYDDESGDKEYDVACISKATWHSYKNNPSYSHGPGDDATKEVEAFETFKSEGVDERFVSNRKGYKEICLKREKDDLSYKDNLSDSSKSSKAGDDDKSKSKNRNNNKNKNSGNGNHTDKGSRNGYIDSHYGNGFDPNSWKNS